MTDVVVDASALVDYLLDRPRSTVIAEIVEDAGTRLHAPGLCDLEIASAIRRGLIRGWLAESRAREMVADYTQLPVSRHEHLPFLTRILELRENFGAFDAAYASLAEVLGATLLTSDDRFASAAVDFLELRVVRGRTPRD